MARVLRGRLWDERDPQRPLALVTGASTGIGLELARQFADHNFDLVIAAEDDPLETAAASSPRRARSSRPSASTSRRTTGVDAL